MNSTKGYSRIPRINPTIKPNTIALASLSIIPAKNPTARIMAITKDTHEKPMNNPINDKIIAAINAIIVGMIIIPRLILSKKEVGADSNFETSPVEILVPHSGQNSTSSFNWIPQFGQAPA